MEAISMAVITPPLLIGIAISLAVSRSYGVTVCGPEVYKQCMERGWQRVKDLGLVLGPLHPVIGDVLPALKRISGKEEVSCHAGSL
jgi:glutamate-1-semialdehyde 2,1-aminomutase